MFGVWKTDVTDRNQPTYQILPTYQIHPNTYNMCIVVPYWNAQDSDSSPSSLHCRPRCQGLWLEISLLTNLRFGLRNTLILDTLASHVKLSVQVLGKQKTWMFGQFHWGPSRDGVVLPLSFMPGIQVVFRLSREKAWESHVIRGTPWYPCFRTISDTLQDERLRWTGKFLRAESLFAPATDGCRVLRAVDGSKPNAILGEMNSHLYPLKYRCWGVECRVGFKYPYQFWILFILFSICNLPVWCCLCSEWGNCNSCRQRLWHTVPCGHRSVLCSVPVFCQTSRSFAIVTQRNWIPI